MSWTTVKTNKGLALDQKLVVSGGALTLTKAGAGTQVHSSGTLAEATSLSSPTSNAVGLGQARNKSATQITIPVTITSKDVETSYTAKQIGIFAEDPDDGEILYAISEDSTGIVVPTEAASVGFSTVWNFEITMANSGSVTVSASGFLTAETAAETYATIDDLEDGLDEKGNADVIVLEDVYVAGSAWGTSSAYEGYEYSASITISGATADHYADVCFSMEDALSGEYSPICETIDGAVLIYSKEANTVTIPSIVLTKAIS